MVELDILILGPVPPPFGGIGVHLGRLVPLLERAGLRVGVLNHYGSTERAFILGSLNQNPLRYYRFPRKIPAHIVHYHHSHWLAFMAVALGKQKSKSRYVITLHGNALARRLNSRIPLVAVITRWGLRRFDTVIVVNDHIRSAIEAHIDRRRIHVIPAFLQATEEEPSYEPSINAFLSSGRTLLVSANRVQFLPNGRDLYGFDTAVDAFVALARTRPNLRLAFFMADRPRGRRASHHLDALLGRLERAGLRQRVLIVFGLSLLPAFRHDVILVRPTRSEGDAVSVREAICAKVPVVASDVVSRPPGATTFSTGDPADLSRVLSPLLDTQQILTRRSGGRVVEVTGSQFLSSLIRIYREELEATPPSHAR
jgi:glycosyltransferase involved in cell wall biosynthesis